MRKIIAGAVAVSLGTTFILAGTAGAAETKKTTRKVTKEYAAPGGVSGVVSVYNFFTRIGGAMFSARRGESFIAVKVVDDLGQKVAGTISQDYDGDRIADRSVDFCGATKRPVRIEQRYQITVFISEGPCVNGDMAAASRGKVIATFSNIR